MQASQEQRTSLFSSESMNSECTRENVCMQEVPNQQSNNECMYYLRTSLFSSE